MTRVIVLVVLTVVAVAVAWLLQRRRPERPSAPSYRGPTQVDRADFVEPTTPGLIALFSSATCASCPDVWTAVQAVQRPGLAIERIDVQDDPARHQRYRIDGVPTTLVIDAEGVVTNTFFGPLLPERLRTALDSDL